MPYSVPLLLRIYAIYLFIILFSYNWTIFNLLIIFNKTNLSFNLTRHYCVYAQSKHETRIKSPLLKDRGFLNVYQSCNKLARSAN